MESLSMNHTFSQQYTSSLDRRLTCATYIDESPQQTYSHDWSPRPNHLSVVMEVSESESTTPTGLHFDFPIHKHQFDDLYDVTDNEAEEVPIQISMSPVAQTARPMRNRYPSLVIPSPSKWPTVQQMQKKGTISIPLLSPGLLSPNTILSPTVESLARLAARNAQETSNNAPSLDGSMTSDELSNLSCPSTPDIETASDGGDDWNGPIQLHREALETLDCLTGRNAVPEASNFVAEMQQVDGNHAQDGSAVDMLITPVTEDGTMSFLSIPSPGGFFSTLEPSSRNTWATTRSPTEQPSTSIAELFYGVPWRDQFTATNQPDSAIVTQTVTIPEDDDNMTEGPLTARYIPASPPRSVPVDTIPTPVEDPTEYKETYAYEVQQSSVVNLDRTSHWLAAQTSYLPQLPEDDVVSVDDTETIASDTNSVKTASPQKSVRFGAVTTSTAEPVQELQPLTPIEKDETLAQGLQYLHENTQKSDAFMKRKIRSDALRLDRECLFSSHIKQVEGNFELTNLTNVASSRPVSNLFGEEENTEEKQIIATAHRERQALQQIQPISWNLEATKYLNGGNLLMSPTGRTFARADKGRVLDLGGQATADWAWQVAIEHPHVQVHTVYTAGQQKVDKTIGGPANCKQTAVPNLWTLPFPANHFDVVSARNLFALLRTSEYDACLRECMRILKPGGYLEFALLDADILNAGPLAQSLSVEFSFNLKTRGYDSAPTKAWLPRLRKAGFADVRRAWLVLPMARHAFDHDDEEPDFAEASTRDASYISGMVGSWAWERWMLKVQREMGKSEEKLLDGVAAALEEGARTGASWRYLSGYARKPFA